MTEGIRDTVIRIKLLEMAESVDMARGHLPDSVESFEKLGIIKDGIYKRIEYAIENVFDICAIVNYPSLKGGASCFMDNTCITEM
ncbi:MULTISPECIES: hypothetical protein [unclassified Methanoculleus]|uniref:hypothetical protein n=1 Tax=unclassified Methanoculleus TaxID=2619537 RepID=UPI0025FDF1D6|nr:MULTISPECIES: hypothetical protein [unclassified Methanoculleus]